MAELAAALRSVLQHTAFRLHVWASGDCTVLDVRAEDDAVLVTFRFRSYPEVLGYRLQPISQYAEDGTVSSAEDWASDAHTWLEEQLGTGLIVRGAREQRDGYLELIEPGFPVDERFYSQSASPTDVGAWVGMDLFRRDGFDTTVVEGLRADGSLISWDRAYLNNAAGRPWVGHVAVAQTGPDTAHLAFCQITENIPGTVMLWLCLCAAHEASWHGARLVTTDLTDPVLDLIGFRHCGQRRELLTDFLRVDHQGAAQLIDDSRGWKPSRRVRRVRGRTGT